MNEIKNTSPKLYYEVVKLLDVMKNGGGSIRWILNIFPETKTTKNLRKALHHINIAINILQGTLYP